VLIISGCASDTTRYRCYHKQEQLQQYGIESLVALHTEPALFADVTPFDVVVLHRVPLDDAIHETIRQAHALRRPVVFDTDDLIFDLPMVPWIRGLEKANKEEVDWFIENTRRCRATLDRCDLAFASTEYLAKHLRRLGKRALVVRNCLSQDLIRISERAISKRRLQDDKVVLGYFSGTNTHDRDFVEASEAIITCLEDIPSLELMVVGPLEMDARYAAFGDRIRRLDLVPWQELPELIAQVDINLAPLELGNPFCESKSELKYLEAAVVAVPTVATPTSAYSYAIQHRRNGLLASNREEWETSLRLLISDQGLRARIGENARTHVLKDYSPVSGGRRLLLALGAAVRGRGYPEDASLLAKSWFVLRRRGGPSLAHEIINYTRWRLSQLANS